MDFLNKAYVQIADLFRTMTPGARLTAGLLLVVVVVSLGYLFTNQISGPSGDLMHGVPISGAQQQLMMSAFGKANLNDAVIQGGQIFVPRGQEAKYMGALADAKALPPNFGTAIQKAIESGNSWMSSEERKDRMKIGVQEELSLWISRMPGMDYGSVIFSSDITGGFRREKVLTATATAKLLGTAQLDDEKVSSIRHLVAGAIAGMKPENVTVMDINGRAWPGTPGSGGGVFDDDRLARIRTYENDLKAKIVTALSYIPNVTVAATVTLDPTKSTQTHETKLEPKPVDVRVVEDKTNRTADTAGPGGRPGVASQRSNAPMSLAAAPSGGTNEQEDASKSETISIPSGKETNIVKLGQTPTKATVSVGIPVSYFKKIWQDNNPTAAGKEQKGPDEAALAPIRTKIIADVKKQVANLLPAMENNADPAQLVEVTDFQEISTAPPPEPTLAKNALLWLGDYWSVAGMIGLAGVSLLMLRSLVKAAPPLSEQSSMPRLANVPLEETGKPAGAAPPPRVRRFTSGPSLRDEISVLVKEDPDTAANILKTWIGHAG